MKKIFFLLLLGSTVCIYAQEKVYLDSLNREIPSAEGAKYYQVLKFDKSVAENTKTTFYLNEQMASETHYSVYWKGIRSSSREWYENGKSKLEEHFDTSGKRQGSFKVFWNNGAVKRDEEYNDDKMIQGQCFDENGQGVNFFPYMVRPEFPGGIDQFRRFIAANFRTPDNSNFKGGRIVMNFVIDIDGSLKDIKAVQIIDKETTREAFRILLMSPKWTPGKLEGKVVPVSYQIPFVLPAGR